MNTCTVNESFLGIPGPVCGQPAATDITWTCPHGHRETAPVCVVHAPEPGVEQPQRLCPVCAETTGRRVLVEVAR